MFLRWYTFFIPSDKKKNTRRNVKHDQWFQNAFGLLKIMLSLKVFWVLFLLFHRKKCLIKDSIEKKLMGHNTTLYKLYCNTEHNFQSKTLSTIRCCLKAYCKAEYLRVICWFTFKHAINSIHNALWSITNRRYV